MIQHFPIHELRTQLEAARLKSIKELAAKKDALAADALQELAILQSALTAVREEIAAHEVRLAGGAEQPLK